jgi:hypothetical protein
LIQALVAGFEIGSKLKPDVALPGVLFFLAPQAVSWQPAFQKAGYSEAICQYQALHLEGKTVPRLV